MSSTSTDPDDDRTDAENAAVTEAVTVLLDGATAFDRDELAEMTNEQRAFLFNATFPEDDESEQADESDEQDTDADADADADDVATNAAPGRGGRRSSESGDGPATAGTMANYCERNGIEDGSGDARRANSDRYHVPLETDDMQANAGDADDYPGGTMADYQDRDVDPAVPRRQQAQQADDDDAGGSEQGGDFGWPDTDDDGGDVDTTGAGDLHTNQSAHERAKQAADEPLPGTMAAYLANKDDESERDRDGGRGA